VITNALPEEALSGAKTLDWRLILPVFVAVSMYAAGMAAVMPVLPFYVREMGGSPLVVGMVIAAEALSQFVSAPVLGQLSDRFGRKRILLASQAVAAVSLLLLAGAPTIFVILLARALFGMTAGNLSAAAAYVADHSDARNRRQAFGILTGGVGVGGMVGAGLSGLFSDMSLTVPIYAGVALMLFSMVVTYCWMDSGQTIARLEAQTDHEKMSFRVILESPVIRILLIVMLCHFFAYGMYTSQMPVFLADTFVWNGHAFGHRELSYIMMADGAINVLVQLFLLGWLGKYFTERTLIVVIFALAGAGFLTAGLATTIPFLVIAIVFVSVGDALAKPTYLAAMSVHVPARRQGVVFGASQALLALMDVVSPVLGGFILGYALYGVWIGIAVAVALVGTVLTITRLPTGAPSTMAQCAAIRE